MARFLRLLELALVEEMDARRRQATLRRVLRDSSNPFEVSDDAFIQYFRIPKVVAQFFCTELQPHLSRVQRRGLTVHCQVLVTLRFLAEGGYQRGVGQDALLSVSQPTVSTCLKRVTRAIAQTMLLKWVKFPRRDKWEGIGERFRRRIRFPGVIGAVDCTHIAIVTPILNAEGYRNHKGFFSLNVQMICDDEMRILNIKTYPGSVHDQFIWSHSRVRRMLMDAHQERFGVYFLIGDSGYALEPWLLTPLPHAEEGTPEFRYTAAHCATRSVVERLFGVLKGRWRCLLRDRVLHYQPQRASEIISVCAILHNILLHFGVPLPEEPEEDRGNVVLNAGEAMGDALVRARRIQSRIIQQYFT